MRTEHMIGERTGEATIKAMGKATGSRRERKIYIVCLCLAAAAFLTSLCIGKYPISLSKIGNIVTGRGADEMAKNVFFSLRLPRSVMAFLAGAGLSVAGSIYQSIFRNPLASPDLIGVSSGASAGAAFAIVCLNGGVAAAAGSAFIGGLLAVGAAVLLAGMTKQRSAADFVLAGIAVKALSDSFIMAMKYMADPERQLASIDYWSMGSFANVTMDKLIVTGPIVLLTLLGLIFFRWQIKLLALSDDEAKMLGVPVHIMRCMILALTTLMVASIICVTGAISFIGLIAPHIARLLLKKNDFSTALISGLIGSFIILVSDCLARSLAASEVPISILTSVIGVPMLLWLLCKKEAKG